VSADGVTSPALRYHGGKFRLAPWVIRHFPAHRTYVEPYGGAAGVLLRKPRAYAEVYNDLDGEVVNFFRVLRDEAARSRLIEQLTLTPYSRAEFDQAYVPSADPVECARRLCIRAGMGFGSAGATKGSTGFRVDSKRAYSTAQHVWARYPDQLAAVGLRFSGVLIENRPAIEVMRQHDAPDALHFVDPPYLPEVRVLRGQRYYRHEMTADEHGDLLDAVRALRGMVVIAGYPSDLYTQQLAGWRMVTTQSRISARCGTALRTEALWLNPACAAALDLADAPLFAAGVVG